MNDTISLPEDIKPAWYSLIRRFQSVAKTNGFAVITISVLVDKDGIPQSWLEPNVVKIEPKSLSAALMELFKVGR